MAKSTDKQNKLLIDTFDEHMKSLINDLFDYRKALLCQTKKFDFSEKRDDDFFKSVAEEGFLQRLKKNYEIRKTQFDLIEEVKDIIDGVSDDDDGDD